MPLESFPRRQPAASSAAGRQKKLLSDLESARRKFREALNAYEHSGGRYIDRAGPVAPEAVATCRLVPDRYEMLRMLTQGGVVAEIGTDKGAFAARILETCRPSALHVFELEASRIDRANIAAAEAGGVLTLHVGDSAGAMAAMPDAFFDWIYVDGDHSYTGVRRDIEACLPKLKTGGLLIFNDYCVWSVSSMSRCGVAKAVNQLLAETGWKMVYLALQTSGYFDAAIQKEAAIRPVSFQLSTSRRMTATSSSSVSSPPPAAAASAAASGAPALLKRGRERYERFSEQHRLHFGTEAAGRLLDYGCGARGFVAAAARAGLDAVGVDVTESREKQFGMIAQAAKMPLERLMRYDGRRLPFGDAHFDIVYSWFVLEHVPDALAAVRDIARVTRKGGRVFLYADDALNGWDGHARIPWPVYMPRRFVRPYLDEFGLMARADFIEKDVFYCSSDEVAAELDRLGFELLHRNAPVSSSGVDGRQIQTEEAARTVARDLRARLASGDIDPPRQNLTIIARKTG